MPESAAGAKANGVMTRRQRVLGGPIPAAALALASAVALLPVARLDFDRHHDVDT